MERNDMPKVMFDQSTIYYDVLGEGIPILFIHPPGLGRVVFQSQMPLSKHFQLIMPDLSGHGDSTGPLSDNIVNQYCEEIHAVIKHEEIDKVVLCAYSAGGTIAQCFITKYPEYIHGLIISGGYPRIDTVGLGLMYHLGVTSLLISPRFLAKCLAMSNSTNKEDKIRLLSHLNKTNVKHWYDYYRTTAQFDVTNLINQIKCPSLFIYGNKRDFTRYYKTYYDNHEHIKLAYVDDAAHQIPSKYVQAFNHLVLQFIDRTI